MANIVALFCSFWVILTCPVWGLRTFNKDPTMIKAAAQLEGMAQNALKTSIDTIIKNSSKENNTCTLENLRVRRNWRAFTSAEKKSYIKSVLCLTKAQSITPSHFAPGARSRFDDFVATHISQAYHVHRDGLFLAWHRYFIYEYEQALRTECNYTGDYPYWNWAADADNLEESPIFDGTETSISGNGAHILNEAPIGARIPGPYPPLWLPRGTGGGCVTSGPFKNLTVNLGPSYLAVPGDNITRMSNPLDYNPRCLKRDLTTAILQLYVNYTSIVDLITQSEIVWDLQDKMQGRRDTPGLHGGGHFAMGGDPGRDADASAGDPAFYHHHGMVDRIWWIWQNMDLKRQDEISGTSTFMDTPASANVTLDYLLNVGYANGNRRSVVLRDLMSTTAGPFCYVYL